MRVATSADIGKEVRSRRKELGLTQAEAAGLCNTGIRFFSELENGKPTLEIDKVLNVLNMLGYKIILEDKT